MEPFSLKEVARRRTFAIISHPDAGKTTLTEKLLLMGGAIQLAGSVKAKRARKFATSDWMELEKQRGISVTSSVMNFAYEGLLINLIDTPGHDDFSEDTYRTLTAVDSTLMLLDAAGGVEAQTRKLFEVCRQQKTPTSAFINKMDREGKEPFDLLDEIETTLGLGTCPLNWPLGRGSTFRGVVDRVSRTVSLFDRDASRSERRVAEVMSWDDPKLRRILGEEVWTQGCEELQLLDTAGTPWDQAAYLRGELAPVYFGTALFTFGVEDLLKGLCSWAPAPQPKTAQEREVKPSDPKFSGFIFKIQANMDPAHRDRVAFVRICSGRFERGMKALHVRSGKTLRLARPTQFLAQDRSLVDLAYAGDIVGIHDPGLFAIGDSLSEDEPLHFCGIPVFAPELFAAVELKDPMRSKQLTKALQQLSEEGSVQVLRREHGSQPLLGVVGALQFDVVKFRVQTEYGVDIDLRPLPYRAARWLHSINVAALQRFIQDQGPHICRDRRNQLTVLLDQEWRLKFHQENYPEIEFVATGLAPGS